MSETKKGLPSLKEIQGRRRIIENIKYSDSLFDPNFGRLTILRDLASIIISATRRDVERRSVASYANETYFAYNTLGGSIYETSVFADAEYVRATIDFLADKGPSDIALTRSVLTDVVEPLLSDQNKDPELLVALWAREEDMKLRAQLPGLIDKMIDTLKIKAFANQARYATSVVVRMGDITIEARPNKTQEVERVVMAVAQSTVDMATKAR